MLGALIREFNSEEKPYYLVEQIVDVSSYASLNDIKNILNYSHAIAVDETVKVGMSFIDGVIYNNKEQIYPSPTAMEQITKLSNVISEITYSVDENSLDVDALKTYFIKKNKNNLAEYLENHPMTFNEKVYTITEDKQNQLTGILNAYTYANAVGLNIELSWNEMGEECKPYTFEELVAIYLQMLNVVKPIVTYQQHTEIAIKNATTKEELLLIDITFKDYGKSEDNQSTIANNDIEEETATEIE